MKVGPLSIEASVRPKPGFSIGNQNQGPIFVSASEPKLFFPKLKLQKMSCFPISWEDVSF